MGGPGSGRRASGQTTCKCESCGVQIQVFPSYEKRSKVTKLCRSCWRAQLARRRQVVIRAKSTFTCFFHQSAGRWMVSLRGKIISRARLVMECILGRRIRASEIVVHRSGDIADDSPGNLYVAHRSDGLKDIMKRRAAAFKKQGRLWGMQAIQPTTRRCTRCIASFTDRGKKSICPKCDSSERTARYRAKNGKRVAKLRRQRYLRTGQ